MSKILSSFLIQTYKLSILSKYYSALRRFSEFKHKSGTTFISLLVKVLPYPQPQFIVKLLAYMSLLLPSPKCRAQFANANMININLTEKLTKKININVIWIRKALLETSIKVGIKAIHSDLDKCAKALEAEIKKVDPAKPFILAPFHTVSDVIAGVISAKINGSEAIAISTIDKDTIVNSLQKHIDILSLHLSFLNPAASSFPTQLKNALRKVKSKQAHIVIYPDVPPETTRRLSAKSMPVYQCELFGRTAQLHSGLSRMAKLMKANVIFYALFYENGALEIDILGTEGCDFVESRTPFYVEKVVNKYATDWMLWSTPSFFYYNSGRLK